jgi:hypothetical protein
MTDIAPIAPPLDDNPGHRPEGCLHIAADVDSRSWRYCQRPIHRGAWCAAHYAACHRWEGHEGRQRRGEYIVRVLAGADFDVAP